jgi:hypothetical protein
MARPKRRSASVSAAMAIACLMGLVAVAAAAPPCKDGNKGDANKSKDNVEDWAKTCADANNDKCHPCSLWIDVVGKAKSGDTFVYWPTDSTRAKILPNAPLQGLESIVRDKEDGKTGFLWARALQDAGVAGKLPRVSGTASFPVAFENSLHSRTQHQMHIHIGQPKTTVWQKCVQSVIANPPAPDSWIKPIQSMACNKLTQSNPPSVTVRGTTAASADKINRAIRYGFETQVVPHSKGSDITSNDDLLNTAVLVQPNHKNQNQYLVFLITGHGVNDHLIY